MRRFHYRFQRILEIKERMEEARKLALGEVVAILNQEQQSLEHLEATQARYRRASKTLATAPLQPVLLGTNENYLLRLRREIDQQLERIGAAEEKVEERRNELLEATKERKVFEVLRERDAQSYDLQRRRTETMALDEVGMQVYRRALAQSAGRDTDSNHEGFSRWWN